MMTKVSRSTIIHMRQSGASLQQIASHFGVSRERVRQLLVKHYGSTKVNALLGATDLARQVGSDQSYIRKLRRRGIIQPARVVGKKRTLWKPETVDTIARYVSNCRCRVCDGPLPSNRWVYCSRACWIEAYRHRYIKMSEQEKRVQKERVARWFKNHPEQARDIRRRYQRKRWARESIKRYKSTRYIIWKKCLIPLGTVVKVIGHGITRSRLRVEWGEKIIDVPFCSVKRIEKQS